jgi:hypothetical protein
MSLVILLLLPALAGFGAGYLVAIIGRRSPSRGSRPPAEP